MGDGTRTIVERWLIRAEHDIKMAYAALLMAEPLTDMACFHAQQCAEKALKAFLAFNGEHPEKTHDLSKLLTKCSVRDFSFEEWKPVLFSLTDYAVNERYADNWREILLDEAQAAVKNAEKCVAFVKAKIGY